LVVTKAILLAGFRALYCRPSEFVVCSTWINGKYGFV
jgi:hypothetical protein